MLLRLVSSNRIRAGAPLANRPDQRAAPASMWSYRAAVLLAAVLVLAPGEARAQLIPVTPPEQRGRIDAERMGHHDANRIRTRFFNFGMVGDYPPDPGNVDLTTFHSIEVPKGTGMNYSNGVTPFVLARVETRQGRQLDLMLTGYRERQAISPSTNRQMRFAPRPGYVQINPAINLNRSVAISNDPRTWPECWPDKMDDPSDPGWCDSWNGYFGKRPAADQESYFVMDDQLYDAYDYFPDSRDLTRRGLGLRVEVRGFQWANPQAQDVIFWHYDVVNESNTDYEDIVFGLYMDSGVGGSALSCEGVFEADDDNAFYDSDGLGASDLNLVYTWDKGGRGVDLRGNCSPTGYLGYAYLETPGNPFDGIDNDNDGVIDERRDSGPGMLIEGQEAIRAYALSNYDLLKFEARYGPLETRPAYRAGRWWTGDENMNWVAEFHDTGVDGVFGTNSEGEGDGIPTAGEPNFDQTDPQESDQIGLTGFKFNRIRPGAGNPDPRVEDLVFYDDGRAWPRRLYDQFTNPDPSVSFDPPLAENYNIGFLFASGPFRLAAGARERFSLALAYGADIEALRSAVRTVQQIYNAGYQFAVPPPTPTLRAEAGDRYVRLYWDDVAERGVDPVTNENDFQGYRVYRSTDPNFLDSRRAAFGNPRGHGTIGMPIAQFDLQNGIVGFSEVTVNGQQYWLGSDTGIQRHFIDRDVVNGVEYYYAVTAYDYGSVENNFFPSENAVSVSRTPRGGTVMPQNVVAVRPNPPVPGFVPANASANEHVAGRGVGSIEVRVFDSGAVPDGHRFRIEFTAPADSVRATAYTLMDLTTGEVLFTTGDDLTGTATGVAAAGLQPVITTPAGVTVDQSASGFAAASPTDLTLLARYAPALPANFRRPGYPEDLVVEFFDEAVETSLPAVGLPARPARFHVTTETGLRLPFRFRDIDGNGTLSAVGEFIEIVTYAPGAPTQPRATWRLEVTQAPTRPPAAGDTYGLRLALPFTTADAFEFTADGARVDTVAEAEAFAEEGPYVVPNPYVASAAFEPERFAVAGRGERRMEFRNVPAGATIRIYTVRGTLVQTLTHDGSMTGMVPWNLRTRDNLEVAPGLYVFHVDAGQAGTHVGRFAIIK
jgi:hypothetical protein